MKKILTTIMIAGSLAFASCEFDTTSGSDKKCIDKLEDSLKLVMMDCSNLTYVATHYAGDAAVCRKFEGNIALITYFECTSEETTK
jgi:hypothetical protein